MSAVRTTAESTPYPAPSARANGSGESQPMLADLLRTPTMSDADQELLVAAVQRGAAASVLLDLELLDEKAEDEARRQVGAGLAARDQILTVVLPQLADLACQRADGLPSTLDVTNAIAAATGAMYRYDPAVHGPFSAYVRGYVDRALSAVPGRLVDVADSRGGGEGGGNGMVTAVRARAHLVGMPLSAVEVDVLGLRFGDRSHRALSLDEAGSQLRMSRYEVRSTEARAIARLRRHPSAT